MNVARSKTRLTSNGTILNWSDNVLCCLRNKIALKTTRTYDSWVLCQQNIIIYSAEPKLWSTEVMKWPKLWTKSWKPKPHSIDFIVIFNRTYELIEVMNYRSYELNLWTKSKNLRLICDRSYEVKETVNFVFVNDYCADDH